jgi:hypothetical protein
LLATEVTGEVAACAAWVAPDAALAAAGGVLAAEVLATGALGVGALAVGALWVAAVVAFAAGWLAGAD